MGAAGRGMAATVRPGVGTDAQRPPSAVNQGAAQGPADNGFAGSRIPVMAPLRSVDIELDTPTLDPWMVG